MHVVIYSRHRLDVLSLSFILYPVLQHRFLASIDLEPFPYDDSGPAKNTVYMCSRAKGMPESTAIFGVDAAGQVYNQTNEFYTSGGTSTTTPTCPSRSTGAYATHGSVSGSTPRTVRPNERSPQAHNPEAKSPRTRDNAVRLRHVEPARVPLRHAAPSPPQVLDSLHRLAKAQSCRPPDFRSGHAYQNGKCEHRGVFTQEADLVRGDLWRAWRIRDCRSA